MVGSGEMGRGAVWPVRLGPGRHGVDWGGWGRFGVADEVWIGRVRSGQVGQGLVGQVRLGVARVGGARRGEAGNRKGVSAEQTS
jgi:hypothetical protein